jgi:protein tyrosine phosphatase
MPERVFVFYTLKPDVSVEEYERWLAEEHYPWGRSLPTVTLLEGFRATGTLDPAEEPEWTNLAIIDVEDREAWMAAQAPTDETARYHWERWQSLVSRSAFIVTERIEA